MNVQMAEADNCPLVAKCVVQRNPKWRLAKKKDKKKALYTKLKEAWNKRVDVNQTTLQNNFKIRNG